jgi:hypothetical protein
MAVLLLWWAVVLICLLLLTAGGPWFLFLPVAVVGVLVVTNTLIIVRRTGPEENALEPGRLARADADRDDGVAVWAMRSPRRRATDRARRTGTLAYVGGRLRFTVDSGHGAPGTDDDPLADVTVLDAPSRQLELGPRPHWLRPALAVTHDGTHHLFDLSPPFDLGAGAVGAVVSAAWWDQLVDRGAHPPTS